MLSNNTACWLALHRTPKVGPKRFFRLMEHFDTPQNVLNASRHSLKSSGIINDAIISSLANPDWDSVEKDLTWCEQENNAVITLNDPLYPTRLKEIADPPPLLFVHGNPQVLNNPQLAMVGSRNPSENGKDTATAFAKELSLFGFTITSGLAIGIDAASHLGALAGSQQTIAVTGTGLDKVYPARHLDLAHQIAEKGALVSEFSLGTPPIPSNFPLRNRIISGLSLGTLVVEATPKSGSLITARMANEQCREVFAIPGSIHNPVAKGCHSLIKQGAKLVECAEDILEEFAYLLEPASEARQKTDHSDNFDALNEPQTQLLNLMGYDPVSIDNLVSHSALSVEDITSEMLALELLGYVAQAPGGLYIKKH